MLLLLLAAGMAVCLAYALATAGDGEASPGGQAAALAWPFGITAASGVTLAAAGRGAGRLLLRKEAVVVVGLGWFVCGLFAMLPYLFCEPGLPPAAAFFESISGLTTTGSTAIAHIPEFPRPVLLWRCMTQWFGGLGILVLFVALLSSLGAGGKSIFRTESSAQVGEGSAARVRPLALRLLGVYVLLGLVGLAGLYLLGLGWFDAVCHTMTAVSTGGFANYDESVAYFRGVPGLDAPLIEAFLTLLMLGSGITFFFHLAVLRRNWHRVRVEEEARWFLGIVAVATAAITVNLTVETGARHDFPGALLDAAFQVVSIATTTGFATVDFAAWPGFSEAMLVALMIVGGCSGSTAGGLKVARLILFLKVARQEIVAAFRPRQVLRVRLNGSPAEAAARSAVLVVGLFACSLIAGALTLAFLEPDADFDTCFSASAATLFNIGPGLSGVGPAENFAFFGAPSLLVMSLLMVMGRLELFAVLALFVPALWRRY